MAGHIVSDFGASLFEETFDVASEGIDDVFGEAWQYVPMATPDVNGRAIADTSRAGVDCFIAVYQGPFARAFSNETRRQGLKPEHPGHASNRPVCDLTLCRLPYLPKNGDQVVRLKTGDVFKIAEVRPNGVGRAALDLNLLTPAQATS
jgi:hypothetical protein